MKNEIFYRYETVIKSNLHTCEHVKDEDIYEVIFHTSHNQTFSVKVNTTDCGIAVVEAYLFVQHQIPTILRHTETIQYISNNSTQKVESIGLASKYLLQNHLHENNKILVACFISLCNKDSTTKNFELIEHELLESELSGNIANGNFLHYNYDRNMGVQFTINDIMKRCSYIWNTYLFTESVDFDFSCLKEFTQLKNDLSEPEELLFWTFLMCFYGQYDCYYPYTLYLRIKEDSYIKFLTDTKYPSLMHEIIH